MIPLHDDIPSESTPIVNYLLMAVCGLAFLFQLGDDESGQDILVERLGMIPARVFHPGQRITVRKRMQVRSVTGNKVREKESIAAPPPFSPWFTLLTCAFLHGGWMHFIGNMWFLYIFGDNVEDRFGHFGYLAFYLSCAVAASA